MVNRNPLARGNLTNVQWQRLQGLLPKPSPKGGRPTKDHRTIINGILWILRTGAPIALRAFKKGVIYRTAMEPGKPCLVVFMLGGSVGFGNRYSSACTNKLMPQGNLTESFISLMAA